jgi:nucleotide-binding universal stress UspA family protein
MKILLGIEDSNHAGAIAQAIIHQFRSEGTEIRVLNVLEPAVATAPFEMAQGYAPELDVEEPPAHAFVEGIAKDLAAAGFVAGFLVKIGDARKTILDEAALWRADLIVLGSHSRHGIQSILIGSVAESVVRHATCSVEIVRTTDWE